MILVVEDDIAIGALLCMSLEDEGYQVRVVSDGALALRTIQETHPALVLLDFQLPSLNGDQIIARMQTSETLRTIPVIVLSAYRILPEPIHAHAYAILRKPFDLTHLRELVSGLISPSA